MVLIFTDLKKAQIYRIPYRSSPHQEIEILMSFDYLHLFRPNEHSEDYHIRKPNDENFLFKIEGKKYIHVGEKLFSFETNDELVKYSSEHGFNDIKFPFARGKENIYFMLHRKYFPIQEYENSSVTKEYLYLYKKDEELEGDNIIVKNEGFVEYGNDFINCKIIHSKQWNLLKIVNTFKLFAMIEELFFILHVATGIYITMHNFDIVYLHDFIYEY